MTKINTVILAILALNLGCNPFAPVSSNSSNCTGTAILSWDANKDMNGNIDSSVLGYSVYFGFGPRSYSQVLDSKLMMPDPNPTYTVSGLEINRTYYFAVTAYNSGAESSYSNEVSKTVSSCGQTFNLRMTLPREIKKNEKK